MTAERTPTTRDIDWGQLIETALTMPGHMGDTYSRFYRYSFLNVVLLMSQGVQEPVATYKRWQALGRQVLKGSRAKEIVRPIVIEKKDDAGQVTDKKLIFKPVRCLFTYSDTEGDELPEPEIPEWHLPTALTNLEIKTVPFRQIDGNLQGYSYARELAINPIATDPTSTRFHELGHIVLGHTEGDAVQQYRTHRGLYEFEAEATAYVTMNELGQLNEDRASESRAYIQGWLRNDRPGDGAIRQVFSATDKILRAGRPQDADPNI